MYTWGEYESGKGANEVCSALHDCLQRLQKRVLRKGFRRLDLFADSCPGRNKNASLLCMLMQYVNSPKNSFSEIRVIFPVRGHSYMPVDAIFGRIETQYRKLRRIITPESYIEVMNCFGRVRQYGVHWHVRNYKLMSDQLMKAMPAKLRIRDTKVWTFKKNFRGVEMRSAYFSNNTVFTLKEFVRRRRVKLFYKPPLVPVTTHITEAKANDVMVLLSHIELTEAEEKFYESILKKYTKKK